MRRVLLVAALIAIACNPSARRESAHKLTGGDPDAGKAAIGRYGCGACHTIPGVPGAKANVGPGLDKLLMRTYIAGGHMVNNPRNLIAFLRKPREVNPGGAMPDMAVTEKDAKDIAAYLYTLQ